jgi:ATP-dependent RNA helicase HrpB
MEPLPIDDVLDDVVGALAGGRDVVLVAPPGAGKTTRVPQAIFDRLLSKGDARAVVLEPRRLAARLAAERIAAERGTKVGGEVGYQVRFDDRTSSATRIAFLTEGILTRRIQTDPVLEGVGVVVLDEFHERSIHADLAIAFLREIQENVRPDLRIVVMSATLDPGPVASFLRDARVIESEGRMYPVEFAWLEQKDERPIHERVAAGVRRAMKENAVGGEILAFLPGAPEIRRTLELLAPAISDRSEILPLYGELSAKDQDRAVARRPPGAPRRIVLATNIAESSLTIPGVTIVVDSGLAKVPRHDPALGVDRLDLVRISRTSADQRAGRAGRTAAGRAYRLWTKAEENLLAAKDVPEIGRVDLAPAVLEIVRWSGKDPRAFRYFERPAEAMIERAERLLEALGAIDRSAHRLTEAGERLAGVPAHPRIAMMLFAAKAGGVLEEGALLAALASEREVFRRRPGGGGTDRVGASDLLARAEAVEEIERARFSASIVDRLGADPGAVRGVLSVRDRLIELARRAEGGRSARSQDVEAALLRAVLAGFPDRVAKRREKGSDRLAFVGGGGARLSRESVVKEADLLVAIDVDAGAAGERDGALVRIASQIEPRWLEEDTRGVQTVFRARWNASREAVECVRELRYFDLVLEEKPAKDAGEAEIARVLEEAAARDLDRALPKTGAFDALVRRIAFARKHAPESEIALDEDPRLALLGELARGRRSFAELRAIDLAAEIRAKLPHKVLRRLDELAPERIEVPSGRKVELRYEGGPPVLSVRLQEVFGLTATPRVAKGRVPVTVELLAPNLRPVQVTSDLESFWATTYQEVRRELARRYPKHQWPEDPKEGDPRRKPGRRR